MATNKELEKIVNELMERVERVESYFTDPEKSLHKTEMFNHDKHPEPRDNAMDRMNEEERLQSMINAIKILPPNRRSEAGFFSDSDVQAICGFKFSKKESILAHKRADE